jgi:hypothetical protein
MGKLFSAVATWWQGKKTILGGALVMAAAVAGVWYQKLDAVTAVAVFGFGCSISGLAAKLNRHQAELLTAFQGLSSAAADVRAGNAAAALRVAEVTAGDLAPGIATYVAQAPGLFHLSAPSAEEMSQLIRALGAQAPHLQIPVEGQVR